MKMRISYIAAALITAAAFVSCQKDEIVQQSGTDGKTLSATIEDDATRTHLGDWDSQNSTYAVVWDSDDKIKVVSDQSESAVYNLPTGNGSRDGIFVFYNGDSFTKKDATSYSAYSPSTIADDPSNLQWPSEQHYRQNVEAKHTGLIKDVPMLAVESTLATKFRFRNLGGILQLNVYAVAAQTITKIVVKSPKPISGAMTVVEAADDNKISLNVKEGDRYASIDAAAGSRVIEYILPSGIPVGTEASRLFHISMPVGTYSSLAIEFYDDAGNVFDKQLVSGNVTIKRSMITTAKFELSYINRRPAGTLSGKFTVNSSGDTVRFAQGNLQYQASSSSWRFADFQWEYLGNGENSGNTTSSNRDTQTKWIDLFGFGTSGWPYKEVDVYKNPWGTETYYKSYRVSDETDFNLPTENDWGYNQILNGGNQLGLWRTLTSDEWTYLFDTSNLGRTNGWSRSKIKIAENKYIGGLLLFPDGWTSDQWPTGGGNRITEYGKIKELGEYTLDEFAKLSNVGIVFLPFAGSRSGTSYRCENNPTALNDNYNNGYQCTSMVNNYTQFFKINTNGVGIANNGGKDVNHCGYPVRLVRDVTSSIATPSTAYTIDQF